LTKETLVSDRQILLKISPDRIEARMTTMLSFSQVFEIDPGILQLSIMRNAKNGITHALKNIASDERCSVPKLNFEGAIKWAQSREGFIFDDVQVDALRASLSVKLNIVTRDPVPEKLRSCVHWYRFCR
jgi:hypothetical protein